jgi:hypothetical protein
MVDSLSMTTGLRAGAALTGALLVAILLASPSGSDAQVPLEITYQSPKDGDTIGAKPFALQMCFSRPIDIRDLDKGGDFNFNLSTPENLGLGLRIVFQPDGWGVSVYPGEEPSLSVQPSAQREGWLYEWRVRAADDLAVNEGEMTFKVDESAAPLPGETPPVCLPGGGTGTPPAVVNSPGATESPEVSPTEDISEEPSPEASEEPGEVEEADGDDDSDIGPLAFGTAALFAGLAVLGLVMYFLRKRVGFDPHAPDAGSGEGNEGGDEEHH